MSCSLFCRVILDCRQAGFDFYLRLRIKPDVAVGDNNVSGIDPGFDNCLFAGKTLNDYRPDGNRVIAADDKDIASILAGLHRLRRRQA